MPNRTDKILLLLGLFSYWCGQTWIVNTGSMTKDEIAIDVLDTQMDYFKGPNGKLCPYINVIRKELKNDLTWIKHEVQSKSLQIL